MPLSLRQRFEAKVDRSGGPDACHPWTGARNSGGYGHLRVEDRTEYAHRVAWALAGNKITPEKPHILHDCPGGDLRVCCNDRHLWAGTNADNQRDKAKKDRGTKSKQGLPFGVDKRPNGRFRSQAWINGRMVRFGTHATAGEASAVALAAKRRRLDIQHAHA